MTREELRQYLVSKLGGFDFLILDDCRELASVRVFIHRKAISKICKKKILHEMSFYVLPIGVRLHICKASHEQIRKLKNGSDLPHDQLIDLPTGGEHIKILSMAGVEIL